MKTLELLRSLGDRAGHLDHLRLVAGTLATDVARGMTGVEVEAVAHELAWIEPTADARSYLQALRDWTLAWEREREVVRRDQAMAAAIQKPGWREVLEHLRAEPKTATQLAELITSCTMPTIHRWLNKLEELGLVASEEVGNTRPCWVTPRGLFALADVARPADGGAAAVLLARDGLLRAAARPIQHLGLRPVDRTLFWALLYWAVDLLERRTWTVDELTAASDLRTFLTDLSQPWADDSLARDVTANRSRELLAVLWSYRTLTPLVDRDLSFERRFAGARPAADHPGRLAWAIAAIRVAHSAAERSAAPDLVAELGAGAREVLVELDVPLARFWRNHLGAAPTADELPAALADAPIGVADEHVSIVRNLECCRAHLGIVATSNHRWTAVERGLEAVGAAAEKAFAYVPWDDVREGARWVEDNRERAATFLRAAVTSDGALGAAASRWLAEVQPARHEVPTLASDPNLAWYAQVCQALLRLAQPATEAAGGGRAEATPDQLALRQVEQLENSRGTVWQHATVRCAA